MPEEQPGCYGVAVIPKVKFDERIDILLQVAKSLEFPYSENPEQLSCFGGGSVGDETPLEAMKRELFQETHSPEEPGTGYKIEDGYVPIEICSFEVDPKNRPGVKIHFFLVPYERLVGRCRSLNITDGNRELRKISFYPWEEVLRIYKQNTRRVVRRHMIAMRRSATLLLRVNRI